jgi:polysaccharide deacetylase 2 family uncharacterized protein YibQ
MMTASLMLSAGIGIGLSASILLARVPLNNPSLEEKWEQREAEAAASAKAAQEDSNRIALVPSPLPSSPTSQGSATRVPNAGAALPSDRRESTSPALWVPTVALPPPVAIPTPAPIPNRPDPDKRTDRPAWLKYAVAPPPIAGRPMIAMVIDDLGIDRRRADRVVALPGPLTTAWMTYADQMARQAEAARARGHELIIHFPMEPMAKDLDAGPDVLRVSYGEDRLRTLLRQGLGHGQGFVGINNHMGSRFTTHADGMRVVMEELRSHGMLFLDSLTSTRSLGVDVARKTGVPYAARDVFIDNEADTGSVLAQLNKVEQVARRNGSAIGIGHPHDGTIEALRQWLPTLQAKGFVLVPLTTIVKHRMEAGRG